MTLTEAVAAYQKSWTKWKATCSKAEELRTEAAQAEIESNDAENDFHKCEREVLRGLREMNDDNDE